MFINYFICLFGLISLHVQKEAIFDEVQNICFALLSEYMLSD